MLKRANLELARLSESGNAIEIPPVPLRLPYLKGNDYEIWRCHTMSKALPEIKHLMTS